MSGSRSGLGQAGPDDAEAWLAAVSAGLAAAGLAAELRRTGAGLEVAATVRRPGRRETDVIVDEDGYAELRWWTAPGTTPDEAVTAITRATAAVTTPASGPPPRGAAS